MSRPNRVRPPAPAFKPIPKPMQRLLAARARLVFAGQPSIGGSVIELGSRGHSDAATPDGANRRWRAMLTRVDRQTDEMALWIERTLEGEPPPGRPKWRCEACGEWHRGKDAFCAGCGAPTPASPA